MSKNLPALVVAGIAISQDADGRFSLNDLHKAAGGEDRHNPDRFLRLDQTKALVVEIVNSPEMGNKNPLASKAGRYGGSHACKELVYRYAMWISPAFELQVIRAYDALATGSFDNLESLPPAIARQIGGIFKAISTKQHQEFAVQMGAEFAIAIAANREEFDVKLRQVMAGGSASLRHGRTAGQFWSETYKLPKLKNAGPWLSGRLCDLDCQIDGNGRSESGGIPSKLFDPDKVDAAMKGGLLAYCKLYAQHRMGQTNLFPIPKPKRYKKGS